MNRKSLKAATENIIATTQNWLEKAVIGLNLCPFAKVVYAHHRIRYCVSAAQSPKTLLKELTHELLSLQTTSPEQYETTLLIHPYVLSDFLQFNDFLDDADATLEALGLAGKIQIASFHPHYQFAGSKPEDIENYTNRSPYPTLHLLRESSIEYAVTMMSDTDSIYEKNIATLRHLGHAGWQRLWTTESLTNGDKAQQQI